VVAGGLSGEVSWRPGIGSLAKSLIVITKMVPSAPAEIKYLPSGVRRTRDTSP
jgi:hypothetical protein